MYSKRQGPGKVGARVSDLGIYRRVISVAAATGVTYRLGCGCEANHPNPWSHPHAILPDAACGDEPDAPRTTDENIGGTDLRDRRGVRYGLAGVLALTATLAGCCSFAAIGQWAGKPQPTHWPRSVLPAVAPRTSRRCANCSPARMPTPWTGRWVCGSGRARSPSISAARHTGLGLHTPADVLDAAYAAHPERFVRKPPEPPQIPETSWINRPDQPQEDAQQIPRNSASFRLTGSAVGAVWPLLAHQRLHCCAGSDESTNGCGFCQGQSVLAHGHHRVSRPVRPLVLVPLRLMIKTTRGG